MTTPAPSLKALAEAKTDGVAKLTIFTVDPDVVQFEDGWNGRDESPDLIEYRQRLKAAMKAGAFVPPIDVQMVDGTPVVRDGHSRTLMARELKAEGMPYTLQARQIRGNDAEMRYHMLGSAPGRPLSPLEQGRQYMLLTRLGETVAQIAARLGQSRSTIENGLQLAEMPSAVQQMVGAGEVASHTALKTVKAHGKAAPEVLAAAVKTAKASGKKKATGKHLNGPKVRGQTLPPAAAVDLPEIRTISTARAILGRLAAVNIVVSNLDRATIAQLVQDARAYLESTK